MLKKIASAVLVLPLLWACSGHKAQEATKQAKFELSEKMLQSVKYEKAQLRNLQSGFRLYGKIVTDNNKTVEVFPFVSGNVLSVKVELGDYVSKGQLLAVVESVEAAEYEKQMQDAENDVLLAKRSLRTTQELFEGKLNSERDVLIAKSELEKAQSQLKRVKEIYSIYNLKPGSIYEIRAPISGFITQKNINQDMHLRTDHSNNVFDISQLDEVWVLANVNESDIANIKIGMEALVTTVSYPDRIFKGKIDKIFNLVDVDSKAMKARIKLHNKEYLLKPEMFTTVTLSAESSQKMLAIPSSAVVFDKNKYFVMLYNTAKNIETREIEIYRQCDGITFVSKGLNASDNVITKEQLLIYDALND